MDRPTLTAIYGRRRLGKYSLITRVITDNDVYYLADESESSAQRILLSKVVAQKFDGFDKVTYPDWETLFRSINYRTEDIDQDDAVHMANLWLLIVMNGSAGMESSISGFNAS